MLALWVTSKLFSCAVYASCLLLLAFLVVIPVDRFARQLHTCVFCAQFVIKAAEAYLYAGLKYQFCFLVDYSDSDDFSRIKFIVITNQNAYQIYKRSYPETLQAAAKQK